MSENRVTMDNVVRGLTALLCKALAVQVEVTARGRDTWTISGSHQHAAKTAEWLVAHKMMTEESRMRDEDETFIYLRSP